MLQTQQRNEIEIKLSVLDVAALRKRLKNLRAREISPRTHEFNTLYDTPNKGLKRRGQLIRIRIEQPASNFGKARPGKDTPAILTYKGPPRLSRIFKKSGTQSKTRSRFKIKEEAEARVAGGGEMARILCGLGLNPVFRYEKFRTTYVLPDTRDLKIELDETPVGVYLELAGAVRAIDRAARLLGYPREDYLTETYASLYLADCRRRGQKPGDMLFPPTTATKKLR